MEKMVLLLLISISFCTINSLGQNRDDGTDKQSALLIKKQIIINDLENQIKAVPYAAVRGFARQKLAACIWKEEKDFFSRAESIAITAIDDLYENRSEIPDLYFNELWSKLFVLLDSNAKETANKLRAKYKISAGDESTFFDSLLNEKDGERLATQMAIKSLLNQTQDISKIINLLARLQQRNSPELIKLLRAILDAEVTGRVELTPLNLIFTSEYFSSSNVPSDLRNMFLKVVVDRSRIAATGPGENAAVYFDLLSKLTPIISREAPELLPEANLAHTLLKNRAIQESRENEERNERINNSTDRLSALISEAEKTDNKGIKYDLYNAAVRLALKLKKFSFCVEIIEKLVEIDLSSTGLHESVVTQERDQLLKDVVAEALDSDDSDSANNAIKKIVDPISRAECLWKMADFYFGRKEASTSRYFLDEAIKFATKAEANSLSISTLLRILTTAHRTDPNRAFELNELTAKLINKLSPPSVEDKPHTENYKSYVTAVMIVNWNLLPALVKLAKENKVVAIDLANRINKKEIRTIADFVLLTDSIAQLNVQARKIEKPKISQR